MKTAYKRFFLSCLSVIMGICITFTTQGILDRAHTRKEVRSALWLVRTELTTNLEDINYITEYLQQEQASAQYLVSHRNDLASCPKDTISFHSGIILADVNATISNDALELLQSSSLFQKLGNSLLSMKIIRAYDTCQLIVDVVNHHISDRNDRFENSINENNVNLIAADGYLDITDFINTDYGLYSLRWLTNQVVSEQTADVADIQEALSAIDDYLRRH